MLKDTNGQLKQTGSRLLLKNVGSGIDKINGLVYKLNWKQCKLGFLLFFYKKKCFIWQKQKQK